MKEIRWIGTTLAEIREYSHDARQLIGFELDAIQRGAEPSDWRPVSAVGSGVNEIRIHLQMEYRIFYVAKFEEAIYVLHSFIKKAEKTPKKEIDLGKKRYHELLLERGRK